MQSEFSGSSNVQPPSPEGLKDLMDALKAACSDVSEARTRLETDFARSVESLAADVARGQAAAGASVSKYKRELNEAVDSARRSLVELEGRSCAIASTLSQELTSVQAARTRVETDLDAISTTSQQMRKDRIAWEAQARAAEARHETVLNEIRQSLANERSRIATLEAANQRLADEHASLTERLTTLEKKKLFRLF